MVGEIEKLRPELQVDLLGDTRILANAEVDPDRAGSFDHRAPGCSVPHGCLPDEAVRVKEPLDGLLAARKVGIADQVRPQCLIGPHGSDVALMLRGHRKPGLQLDDPIGRPAADQLA